MRSITTALLFIVAALQALAVRHIPPPLRDVEIPAEFTIDGIVFSPNDDGATAIAVRVVGTPANVVVPDTVSYLIDMGDATYGWDFPVTEVGTWFCRNNTSLHTLVLGKHITFVGGGFLSGCSSIARIKCRMKEPAKISSTTQNLKGVNLESCTLIVPVGSKPAYTDPNARNARYWRDFTHIIESDGPLFELGDVNGDSFINGADISALYNVLLDEATPVGDADVNGDGIINGADISALYNLLLQ